MAALGGNEEAGMGVGYRLSRGLGAARSCDKALPYYELAANAVARTLRTRHFLLAAERTRLSAEHSAYGGPGGSLLSVGGTRAPPRSHDRELYDYYRHLVSKESDTQALVSLALLYLLGSRETKQDVPRALLFYRAAAKYGHVSASGVLGYYMLLDVEGARGVTGGDGDGLPINFDPYDESPVPTRKGPYTIEETERHYADAVKLLQYASIRGDPTAHMGLGYAHFAGLGFPRNLTTALGYFNRIAGKHPDARYAVCLRTSSPPPPLLPLLLLLLLPFRPCIAIT
jgi:TPR repeat protein